MDGPIRRSWPNFSALSKKKKKIPPGAYHCHLKKGRPTYVVFWRIQNKKVKIVEVFYVGSHEDVPY